MSINSRLSEQSVASIRMSDGFRRLQSSVNRYLNDSGNWISNIQALLEEMDRLTKDLEKREQAIAAREAKLAQRESQLNVLFENLVDEVSERKQAS
jgi:hypothetical protein